VAALVAELVHAIPAVFLYLSLYLYPVVSHPTLQGIDELREDVEQICASQKHMGEEMPSTFLALEKLILEVWSPFCDVSWYSCRYNSRFKHTHRHTCRNSVAH
jgi:hypothetical protein